MKAEYEYDPFGGITKQTGTAASKSEKAVLSARPGVKRLVESGAAEVKRIQQFICACRNGEPTVKGGIRNNWCHYRERKLG